MSLSDIIVSREVESATSSEQLALQAALIRESVELASDGTGLQATGISVTSPWSRDLLCQHLTEYYMLCNITRLLIKIEWCFIPPKTYALGKFFNKTLEVAGPPTTGCHFIVFVHGLQGGNLFLLSFLCSFDSVCALFLWDFCALSFISLHWSDGCGAAEATGLGFVCFVVINPCVLSANRVDLRFLFHKFSNFTPPPLRIKTRPFHCPRSVHLVLPRTRGGWSPLLFSTYWKNIYQSRTFFSYFLSMKIFGLQPVTPQVHPKTKFDKIETLLSVTNEGKTFDDITFQVSSDIIIQVRDRDMNTPSR